MAKRKPRYGGSGYGLSKEKRQAPKEIRKRYPRSSFSIRRSPGSRGPGDFKVFRKLKDGSVGACVAVIQVKASTRVGGAKYRSYDTMRLRMSASHHSPKCKALFLLLERGRPRWKQV